MSGPTAEDRNNLPISTRVAESFEQLRAAAKLLNLVSDQLGTSISTLDAAFQRLNLGITTWVKFAHGSDSDGSYWQHQLGYTKVGSTWGIALRATEGNEYTGDLGRDDVWLFSDAPRVLRLNALDKLPELFENLAKEATSVAEKIKSKIEYAQEVTRAIAPPPTAAPPSKAVLQAGQNKAFRDMPSGAAITFPPELLSALEQARTIPPDVLRAMEQASTIPPELVRALDEANKVSPELLRAMDDFNRVPPELLRAMDDANKLMSPELLRSIKQASASAKTLQDSMGQDLEKMRRTAEEALVQSGALGLGSSKRKK